MTVVTVDRNAINGEEDTKFESKATAMTNVILGGDIIVLSLAIRLLLLPVFFVGALTPPSSML